MKLSTEARGTRFADLQIFVQDGLEGAERKRTNINLFSTYEILRLWIRERRIQAPFGKLLVTLVEDSTHSQWHGHVGVAIGICEVTEAVDPRVLLEKAVDHTWVLGLLRHALERVYTETGWRCAEFEDEVEATSKKTPPLFHLFSRLSKTDRLSATRCDLLLAMHPGRESQLIVRLSNRDKAERKTVILSKKDALLTEDDFPAAKSVIRDGHYLIIAKAGDTLASVPIS